MSCNHLPGLACSALALCLSTAPALAAADLIINGNFEATTMTAPTQIGYATSTTANGVTTTNANTVTGWTNVNNGYNFLFFANNASATGQYGDLSLYTSANGGTGRNATLNSPTGGNFIANDGAFQTTAVTQTVSNLAVGGYYMLSFYWAAAQQAGFTGATTEGWNVTFSPTGTTSNNPATTKSTMIVTTPSQGFTPWVQATMMFTATAATQTLSFLAVGTPGGQPPFSLLDGVSMIAAPEPSSWAVVLTGLGGAMVLARRRRSLRAG